MNIQKSRLIKSVFLPLIVGFGLYVFNEKVPFLVLKLPFKLPDWWVYNLPDGLWSYAFVSAMAVIWKENRAAKWWIAVAFILSLVWEFGQKWGWISGTFDVKDVLTVLFFNILAILNWYASSSKS